MEEGRPPIFGEVFHNKHLRVQAQEHPGLNAEPDVDRILPLHWGPRALEEGGFRPDEVYERNCAWVDVATCKQLY